MAADIYPLQTRNIFRAAFAFLLFFIILFTSITPSAKARTPDFQIKIVHTGDINAHIAENADSGVIGAEKLATIIESYTKGATMDFILDSGNLFYGQPAASLSRGESTARIIRACGYDAVTVGNRDWNYGKARLKELSSLASVSMLAGNITREADGSGFFDDEYYIESKTIRGKELKVGVFGVVDPETRAAPGSIDGLNFTQSAAYANRAAAALREQDCDIIIALAHVNHPSELARQVSGVNLWLAGHEKIQSDQIITASDGSETRFIQSGCDLQSLSLITLSGSLNERGEAVDLRFDIQPVTYDDASFYDNHPDMSAVLNQINAEYKNIIKRIITSAPETLDGEWEDLRIRETNLGRVIADAWRTETGADVAFENAGEIRASISAGDVTYGDIIAVSPYGNYIITKQITGAQLKSILEKSIHIMLECADAYEKHDSWPSGGGNVLQISGAQATFRADAPDGNRVTKISIQGREFHEDNIYTIAVNQILADSEYYPAIRDAKEIYQYSACDEALIRYFQKGDISESLYTRNITEEAILFHDISHDAYYYNAILWAVENGVTSGVSSDSFRPDAVCTRAQAMTFLWRMAGAPQVPESEILFHDIQSGAYYCDAVKWAVQHGVTSGTSAEKFEPDKACTRAQIITFLYRMAGSPEIASDETPFADMKPGAYYYNAVRWAARNGITSGASADSFRPDAACTRAQALTFLMRAQKSLDA